MTTASTLCYIAYTATEAKNRAQIVSNHLKSLLTQVTAPSEINWSLVSWSSQAAETSLGFEIFRFNDTLQATAPLYLKIEYGTGAESSTGANLSGITLWLTIGSNVSGDNVTNVLFSRTKIFQQRTASADASLTTQNTIYTSNMDGSGITFNFFPQMITALGTDTYPGGYFVVERSRDMGGNPTGAGVFIQYAHGTSSISNTSVCGFIAFTYPTQVDTLQGVFVNGITGAGISHVPYDLSTSQSISSGTTTPIFAGTVVTGNGAHWTPRSVLCTSIANVAGAQVLTSLLEGRDYMGTGYAGSRADSGGQRYSTAILAWF